MRWERAGGAELPNGQTAEVLVPLLRLAPRHPTHHPPITHPSPTRHPPAQPKVIYNLYHVLNHYVLFGGGYLAQAQSMMGTILMDDTR